MESRLSRRSALALLLYFALITSVCAPLAYFAGKDRGAFDAQAAAFDPSLFETPADYASLVKALRSGAGCGRGDPGVERYGAWEVYCGPASAGGDPEALGASHLAAAARPGGAGRARSGQDGPLQKAVLRALAGGGAAGTQSDPGNPLSLALAPDAHPGGRLGPGSVPPSGGFPGFLVPGGGVYTPPPGPPAEPPSEPPVLVTPVPPALPLMLAGLGGVYAASRRRKR